MNQHTKLRKFFGLHEFMLIAGPCAVESYEQIHFIAKELSALGIKHLRGGAYKPRTSPQSFQGLGRLGLQCLRAAANEFGMQTVSEIMDTRDIELFSLEQECVDIIQVGSRNMKNYALLKELGKLSKPILLKRGDSATYEDLLLACEYITQGGNEDVILCERGIRTFETETRNTLDLNAVPYLKQKTLLPIIVDPSHGTGIRSLVGPMAKAAIAAGADGLIIEVHENPDKALSDGKQSLSLEEFKALLPDLEKIAQAVGRSIYA